MRFLDCHNIIPHKFQLSVQDLLRRDQIILEIVGELMQFQHYGAIISEMSDPLDVELLLDIILYARAPCSPFLVLLLIPHSYSAMIACQIPGFETLLTEIFGGLCLN